MGGDGGVAGVGRTMGEARRMRRPLARHGDHHSQHHQHEYRQQQQPQYHQQQVSEQLSEAQHEPAVPEPPSSDGGAQSSSCDEEEAAQGGWPHLQHLHPLELADYASGDASAPPTPLPPHHLPLESLSKQSTLQLTRPLALPRRTYSDETPEEVQDEATLRELLVR